MTTRNSRILGLGLALATMLTLGAVLRAPGGPAAVGDDEAALGQGGAATNTCQLSNVTSNPGQCSNIAPCTLQYGWQGQTPPAGTPTNIKDQACGASPSCGNITVTGCT